MLIHNISVPNMIILISISSLKNSRNIQIIANNAKMLTNGSLVMCNFIYIAFSIAEINVSPITLHLTESKSPNWSPVQHIDAVPNAINIKYSFVSISAPIISKC